MTSQLSSPGLSDISGMRLLVRAQRWQHLGFIPGKQPGRKQKGSAKEMAQGQGASECVPLFLCFMGSAGTERVGQTHLKKTAMCPSF